MKRAGVVAKSTHIKVLIIYMNILPLAAFLLLQLGGVASQRQIIGIASPGNTIHVERDVELSYDRTTIKVSSVVPVTVQRYSDGGSYLEGQQPGE